MIKEALQYIIGQVTPDTLEHEGQTFTKGQYAVVKPWEPLPQTIELETLDGLCDYIHRTPLATDTFVHVVSPTTVCLTTDPRGKAMLRHNLAVAQFKSPDEPVGRWMDQEDTLIALMKGFEDSEDRRLLARALGKIKADRSVSLDDDGVSQTVEQKDGVALVKTAQVKPVWKLRPYRTFSVIEQADVDYFLRISDKRGNGVTILLMETDTNAWRIDVMRRIKWYIEAKITPQDDAKIPIIPVIL